MSLSSTVQAEAVAPYNLFELQNADYIGRSGIDGQGPYLYLFAKAGASVVEQASFKTYACPNAIACGSWVCRWMEGKSPDILSRLTADDLRMILGGLPPGKERCADMAVCALREILDAWNSDKMQLTTVEGGE